MIKYGLFNLNPPTEVRPVIDECHQLAYPKKIDRTSYTMQPCLGFFNFHSNLNNMDFIWHNGGTGGFNSELFIQKTKKTVVVILYNSDAKTDDRDRLHLEILDIVNR